jgi:DNA gyrase subunit A
MTTKEEDFVEHFFVANTKSFILFFTNKGRIYWIKVHELPQAGRATKGRAIINLLKLTSDEKVCAFTPVREFKEGDFLVMATKNGIVKKTDLTAFSHPRQGGIIAATLDPGDELVGVRMTDGKSDILLALKDGNSIRFSETDVRPIGRNGRGVIGVDLDKGDEVVGMAVLKEGERILSVTENGYGKRTEDKEYRRQGRGGKGIITIKTTEKNGKVAGVLQVEETDDVMLITSDGKIIRVSVSNISTMGRNTQGVRLIGGLESGAKVVSIAKIAEENGENGANGQE